MRFTCIFENDGEIVAKIGFKMNSVSYLQKNEQGDFASRVSGVVKMG